MSEQTVKILGDLAVALSPVLVALVGLVAQRLAKLIQAKVDNQLLASGLVRVNDAVFTVVKELMQTVAQDLKKRTEDGKLTDAEKSALKGVAMEKLKSYLNLAEIARLYGLTSGDAAEKLLESKLEAAVKDVKDSSVPF